MIATIRKRKTSEYTCTLRTDTSIKSFSTSTNPLYILVVSGNFSFLMLSAKYQYCGVSTKVDQNLSIICTVIVVQRLIVTLTIKIVKWNTIDINLLQDINISSTDDTGSETN